MNVLNLEPWVVNSSDPVSGYAGIPVNITTIAEKMAAGGYYTAAVGKWDVGMASPAHTPLGRGFNESLGYFVHANDYWTAWATYCPGANGAQASRGLPLWWAAAESHACLTCLQVPVVDLWDTTAPARGQNNSWACSQVDALAHPSPRRRRPAAQPHLPNALQASQTGCVYEDALFTARVLSIIEAHDPATPLFLSWTPHVAHVPLEVPQAYLDKCVARTPAVAPQCR